MRAVVLLSCLALAAATASAVPAALSDGTAQFRAENGAMRTLSLGALASPNEVEPESESEEDSEDERDDDERVPEGVLRASTGLDDTDANGRGATRAPARRASAGRDPQNDLQRPPRA